MTSNVMRLTQLEQFNIITYSEINFSFIICHLTYLIFLINLFNKLFQSTYIKLIMLLVCDILLPQIYVYRKVYA